MNVEAHIEENLAIAEQALPDSLNQGEKEIIQQLRDKNDLPVRLFTMGNASFGHMVRSSLNTIPDYRQTR